MTYRQAMLETLRRLEPDKDFTHHLHFADSHFPDAKTFKEITPGKEEEVIQGLLSISKQYDALNEDQLKDIRSTIVSGQRRN